jgi:iron complex transport system substrate-binding protein
MPCGYYAEQAARETMAHAERLAALSPERVIAVDAAAYFSRPGPRLIEGLELLAGILHPGRLAGAGPAGDGDPRVRVLA